MSSRLEPSLEPRRHKTMPSTGRLLLAAVIALVLAGCGGDASPQVGSPGAAGSAGPTASTISTGPTSGSTSDAPPPNPDASPSSPGASTLAHATDPTDVLLRYAVSGGFTAAATAVLLRVPRFSLFGDDTIVSYDPAEATAAAGPPLHRSTMTEGQIQALLAFALDPGGLRSAAAKIEPPGIVSDAQTTSFTIDAGGIDKTVQVYALDTQSPAPNATWAALQALAHRLSDVPALVADGGATDAGRFSPTAYRAYLLPGSTSQSLRDWPWSDIAPEDFTEADESGTRSTTLTPEQAQALAAEPGAGIIVAVLGSDRAPYQVVLVPLLADQVP